MKRIFFSILFALTMLFSNAQSPLAKGKSQINAGVGLSSWGLPIYLGLDYSVHKDITLGAEGSFRSYSEKYKSVIYNHTIIGISGNANYHFNTVLLIPPTWDFYAGVNAGFFIWKSNNFYPGSNTSGLGWGAQVGGRYYINKKVGLNLEVGGGNAFAGGKFGLSIKI